MSKIVTLFGIIALSGLVACSGNGGADGNANYQVIPLPNEISNSQGSAFTLKNGVKIVYPEGNEKMQRNAQFLADYVKEFTGIELKPQAGGDAKGAIVLSLGLNSENKEAYQLKVDGGVAISGASEAGVFYGIQTFRKSMPLEKVGSVNLQPVTINDAPRFGYRGMHLDVARHFFSKDFVKKYIDMLALHNMNRFHWHLSDDQGWRIELKQYPELTELGSQRKETVIGHNSGKYDGKPYGGFYTQDEVKEIIAYAAERYITVIPEIDMPGHMLGALKAYPELGCTGGPYEVWCQWGISDDVLCIGNPKTLEFVKNVLNEIMDIFPSEYIHIGGDECPKVRWAKCPKCQAKIKAEGIKAEGKHTKEQGLQSWFTTYVEKVINDRGRKMIGWDEILEGGLAPNATVMSWRGIESSVEAARQNHDAIMTPTSYCYFDYYQTKDITDEPLSIGGYVPVELVYSFEPVSSELSADESKHILGAQANVWTEYIATEQHVEYMVLPRMAALAEVQWTQSSKKNYKDFLTRLPHLMDIYKLLGYNYAKHVFDVQEEIKTNVESKTIDVTLSTVDNADIYYTLDGSEPSKTSTKYEAPLKINKSCTLKAVAIRGSEKTRVLTEDFTFSKSTAKTVNVLQPINERYKYNGAITLVDGLRGNGNYKTGRYIAFYGNDLEVVVDLGEPTEISNVEIGICVVKGDWVFDARKFTVEVSDNNKTFTKVASEDYPVAKQDDKDGAIIHKLEFKPVSARYVKVTAKTEDKLPAWHSGKGNRGYLFVDEIVVN